MSMQSTELTSRARARAIRRTVLVEGINCVYFEYPGVAGAETIVMIHGYRGNHRGLEAIAGALPNHRILIPDLPGFGESEPLATEHSVLEYSRWLKAFLDSQELAQSAHLVGHSFGTLVLGHYATNHNPRSVVLINPVSAPALQGPRSMMTKVATGYYRLAEKLPESIGGYLLRNGAAVLVMSSVMAKTKDKKLRRWIHDQHLSNFSDFKSVRVATEGYRASISTDLSRIASDIGSPVLVIAAALDDITSIEQQRLVVKSYSDGSISEISGVGHLVHYEAPGQAAKLIAEFIENR